MSKKEFYNLMYSIVELYLKPVKFALNDETMTDSQKIERLKFIYESFDADIIRIKQEA